LQIAQLPCLIGYGRIAARLYNDPNTKREDNRYWKWIETYVAEDYAKAVKNGSGKLTCHPCAYRPLSRIDLIEKHAVRQSVFRIEELVRIFVHATKVQTSPGSLIGTFTR
jgi:ATP-dependent RNA helicase DDX5/DBP2